MTEVTRAEDGGQYRILIVEDNRAMRDFLVVTLKARGYDVTGVLDGEAAIEKVKNGKFHLVLMDVILPRLGGLETLDALKKIDPDIEAIVVTAFGSRQVALKAVEERAYAYLMKPFDLTELEALLPGIWGKISLKSLVGLYEATRAVFADVRLEDLFPDLVNIAKKILSADDISFMLIREDRKLKIVASSGLEERLWKNVSISLGERVAGRVAEWKTGVTIKGPLQSDPRFSDLPSRDDVKFSLVHPILLKDELIGILCASRKEEKGIFKPDDLRHAATFCAQIAQAIVNAKLYEHLEAARKEAIEANALKDDLLRMTTHDLKTPLTIIKGYVSSILDPSADQNRIRSSAERIDKATTQMLSFVHQILRKDQIERGEFKLEKKLTQISDLIDDSITDFEIITRKKGVRLRKDSRLPPRYKINVDPTTFQEIVSNLLTNAINVCGSGGEVKITLESANGNLILEVTDTGPGIALEEQARIFEKFKRGTSARTAGTGHGLAIVKKLTELHGGRIKLTSKPGKGSTFKILLPE